MGEVIKFPSFYEGESSPEPLAKYEIIERLPEVAEQFGMEYDLDEIEYWIELEDGEFLMALFTLAASQGIDHVRFIQELGISPESVRVNGVELDLET